MKQNLGGNSMDVTYVAVGFRVDTSRSIFYFKETNIIQFFERLRDRVASRDPDFVSLRMVKT